MAELPRLSDDADRARNYGIDLLRLVSMFLVVLLHATAVPRREAVVGTTVYDMVYLLRTLSYPCVDVFAIISGWVGWKHPLRFSGIAGTWLQIVWHTVLITAVTALLKPEWLPDNAWTRAFLPVSHKEYWYVTAYAMMLVFVPLLHFVLRRISTALLWIWVAGFLFVHAFLSTMNGKAYGMHHGYNFFWLIGMYLLGAALERSKSIRRGNAAVIGLLLFIAGAVPAYLLIVLAGNRSWIDYCSPLTVLSAAGLVICFSGLKLDRARKMIALVSPTALAVFVIHVHTIPWKYVFYGIPYELKLWKEGSPALLLANICGWALAVFVVCVLLDLVRISLFRALKTDRLLKAADGCLKRFSDRLLRR